MSSPPPRILVLDRTNELAVHLRHNVVTTGAVVKACPDTERTETDLVSGHWDVLVAGPSLIHRAGLRRLAALHARYPEMAILLALHERPWADLAEIVHAGASDLLPLPVDDDEFRQALLRATRIARARRGILAAGPRHTTRGRILLVASASGGCGKTFLATNAAEFLARTTDAPVVLLDLDLQFGEVSTALRLRPKTTIIDALAAEAEGHDLEEILDGFLLNHPDGFKVLAAPRQPGEADSVTPDRPSQVNLGRYLGVLERLGMDPGNVSVVLNKVETDSSLDAGHIAIPYSRDVTRSINAGIPLIIGKPKSKISAMLTMALSAVLSEASEVEPALILPEEPIEADVDLRDPERVVTLDLTDDPPVEIDWSQPPAGRCRAPPLDRYRPARTHN